ncbi:MAG TPA: ribosome-associated translation inhibitor RaiA [Gemmatimonadales bacterium]|jgi:ribosomal subunit interface protein|nr:ribosome-associated translation inhibitor RaiA [Gemmatimonadales bacterium]
MKVIVTARHTDLPDGMRERAHEVLEKLGKLAHRAQRAEAVFDHEHQQHVVELRMRVPRGVVHVASGEADDFRTALDRAAAKLRHQLDKDGAKEPGRAARRTPAL